MVFVTREMLKTNKVCCHLQHTKVVTLRNMYNVLTVNCYFTCEISDLFYLEFLVYHCHLYCSSNVHLYKTVFFSEAITFSSNKLFYINILNKITVLI